MRRCEKLRSQVKADEMSTAVGNEVAQTPLDL